MDVEAVLILVLMEYALRDIFVTNCEDDSLSLNPCFNGICSASLLWILLYRSLPIVLILVLMEYALRVFGCLGIKIETKISLNPCFNGICSASMGKSRTWLYLRS